MEARMTRRDAHLLHALVWVVAVGLLVLPTRVPGQEAMADPPMSPEVREQVERAIALLEERRFGEARPLLENAFREAAVAPVAFNLAVARRGAGDTMGAVQLFEQLLAGAYEDLDEARRAQVEQLLAATHSELAIVIVEIDGASRVEVRIDGTDRGAHDAARPLEFPVNAGTHAIRVVANGLEMVERTVGVGPGQSARVVLDFSATAQGLTAATPGKSEPVAEGLVPSSVPPHPEDEGIASWVWPAGGALVVGLAALGLWLSLSGDDVDGPVEDPVWGIGVTLTGD